MSPGALFICGLGYVGQHLGCNLMAEGWRVGGTTRTQTQAQNLINQGFEAMVWENTTPFPLTALEGITHLLISIPPDEKGDSIARQVDFTRQFDFEGALQWAGYLSATSVYGDHQGAFVSETSLLKPTSARGKKRLLAETQWLEKQSSHFPIHLFRLSGIYGPQRSVLESIRAGVAQRLDKPGHVFSRIHIEDIVTVLKASMSYPKGGEIYNLADDDPASTADVIAYGCELLNLETPPLIPFDTADISSSLREFYADHKRVSNEKIKKALGIKLAFPTYREGLKYC
jgi:nucleoside-diphosphate-sugar epimerase